jgi:predicted TIM-barrel fold metal-dependent hydrolase
MDRPQSRQTTARELSRAVEEGRKITVALRHLDSHSADPEARPVADALARFLVARCDSHHAGWRVVRQVIVESSEDPPWEKCARRAVPVVAEDLIALAGAPGRTPLSKAQHIAAQRRAEQIATHVDQTAVLADLGLGGSQATPEHWRAVLSSAVRGRSRAQVARAMDSSIRASALAE